VVTERVVVSPHLDDAVFSAWTHLTPGVTVVTCFAGDPPAGAPPSDWDRGLCPGLSPSEVMAVRRTEDESALQAVGASPVHLPFVEAPYRDAGELTAGVVAEALRPVLCGAREVWLPAALGPHPDHRLARAAALAAVAHPDAADRKVVLYADLPYGALYGWPLWVRRDPLRAPRQLLRALRGASSGQRWQADLGAPVPGRRLRRHRTRLSADQLARKAEAVTCYRSQLPGVGYDVEPDQLALRLAFEAWWSVE
jgi:LmbE family N-acetylglucosaminyl deacetylase